MTKLLNGVAMVIAMWATYAIMQVVWQVSGPLAAFAALFGAFYISDCIFRYAGFKPRWEKVSSEGSEVGQ